MDVRRLRNSSSDWSNSEAIGLSCNVTSWEDQVKLFQTAFDTFGSVDVVVCLMIRGLYTRDVAFVTGRERGGGRDRRILHAEGQEWEAGKTNNGHRRRKSVGDNIQ